jgi:hypothetical protein
LKDSSAPPRSYGQRFDFAEGSADKTVNIYFDPLLICRVALLLLRQSRGAAGNGLCTMIKHLRRTTSARPKFCAAGARGVTVFLMCVSSAAKLWLTI